MTKPQLFAVVGACMVPAAVAFAALVIVCRPIVDATAVVLDIISRSL